MSKVALIQSVEVFSRELNKEYLGDIPILTSKDSKEIYKYIVLNAKKNNIYKFVLDLDSSVLDKLIDVIYEKKNKSFNIRTLFSKCILIATYSNADRIREKNLQKNTNIYFGISPLSEILNTFKSVPVDKAMLVVSDNNNPFFTQIYNFNIIPKYRISELTIQHINEFSKTGFIIIIALGEKSEYSQFSNLILQSEYNKQLTGIEIEDIDDVKLLINKLSTITSISSGIALKGDFYYYPKIHPYLGYDNLDIMLVKLVNIWEGMIDLKIITQSPCVYNTSLIFKIK
jgi:hypothetical protein